jgi:uncharacterized small protein (DUF1192 family)
MSDEDDDLNVGSLAEINVHLSYMRRELRSLRNVATHDDIRGIKETIAQLATRKELDDKIATLRDEVSRSKPSTMFFNAVRVASGITVFAAVAVLFFQFSDVLSTMKRGAVPAAAAPASSP